MIFNDFCEFRVRAPWISLTLVIFVDFDDFRVRVPWISLTLVILVDFDDFRVRVPSHFWQVRSKLEGPGLRTLLEPLGGFFDVEILMKMIRVLPLFW